jgi:hypothetical protein
MLATIGDRPQGPELVMGLDQLQEMLKPRSSESGSQTAANSEGIAGGPTNNITLNYTHQPMYSAASPSEARRTGMEIIRLLQEFGFTPARA